VGTLLRIWKFRRCGRERALEGENCRRGSPERSGAPNLVLRDETGLSFCCTGLSIPLRVDFWDAQRDNYVGQEVKVRMVSRGWCRTWSCPSWTDGNGQSRGCIRDG